MKNNKGNDDGFEKVVLNFINPFYRIKNKNTYFSYHRRNFYLLVELIIFIVESYLITFIFQLDTNMFPTLKLIAIVSLIVLLTYLLKLETFIIYIKELDKNDIRKNINEKIANQNKISKIESLINIREESNIIKKTIETEVSTSSLINLVNTIVGFVVGYYSKNLVNLTFTPDVVILIFIFIFYLYFISDIIKTAKLYLIELYDYQISYAQRLIINISK